MRHGDHRPGAERWAAPPPADAASFGFPPRVKWLARMAAVLSGTFIALAVAAPAIDPAQTQVCAIVAAIAVLTCEEMTALHLLRHSTDVFAVSKDGIWHLPRQGQVAFIAWCEVVSVTARDRARRLVIKDATGRKRINLDYQLENFEELRELVLHHSTPARFRAPIATVFHKDRGRRGLRWGWLGIFLFLAAICVGFGHAGQSIIFLGFACLPAMLLMREPGRVRVSKNAIAIERIGSRQTIPLDAISSITLGEVRDGTVPAAVIIQRWSDPCLELSLFREGSVALHDALYAAWRIHLRRFTPLRLTIRSESFTVEYHQLRFVVPFATVSDIELTETRNSSGALENVIKIVRDGFATLRLPGFRDQAPLVYSSLRRAWLLSQGAGIGHAAMPLIDLQPADTDDAAELMRAETFVRRPASRPRRRRGVVQRR